MISEEFAKFFIGAIIQEFFRPLADYEFVMHWIVRFYKSLEFNQTGATLTRGESPVFATI